MHYSDISIAKKTLTSFAILIVITIIGGLINHRQIAFIEKSIGWSEHTYDVLNTNAVLLSSMVNRETGMRGYLIAEDRKFLQPYEAGARAFGEALQRLRTLTADNATQQERIGRIDDLARGWQAKVAEAAITLMGQANGPRRPASWRPPASARRSWTGSGLRSPRSRRRSAPC